MKRWIRQYEVEDCGFVIQVRTPYPLFIYCESPPWNHLFTVRERHPRQCHHPVGSKWHNRDWQHWVYSIVLMTRSRTTIMVFSPPKWSTFLKQPRYQHLWKVLPTKVPDYPYSVSLSGLRSRSLVSCVQSLRVIATGLSRDGFTLKGWLVSIRS